MDNVKNYFNRIKKARKKYSSLNDWELPACEARALRKEIVEIDKEFPEQAKMFPDDCWNVDYEDFLEKAPDGMTYKEYLKENGLWVSIK